MAENAVEQAIENIRLKSQGTDCLTSCAVTFNFHPDRYTFDKRLATIIWVATHLFYAQLEAIVPLYRNAQFRRAFFNNRRAVNWV